jgi:HEAT repeat protein
LQHPDPAVRYRAARALGLLGPDARSAVPDLEAALGRGDGALRYQAARALQAIDPESEAGNPLTLDRAMKQEVTELLADVKGDDPRRRRDAILYLGSIGPAAVEVVPELVTTLADARLGSRGPLAAALETISAEARLEVSSLVDSLLHGDAEARAQTADALGAIGADANAAKATLVAALAEPDLPVAVRFTLAEALGEIGAYITPPRSRVPWSTRRCAIPVPRCGTTPRRRWASRRRRREEVRWLSIDDLHGPTTVTGRHGRTVACTWLVEAGHTP